MELSAASVERSAQAYLDSRAVGHTAADRARADRAFDRLHRQMVARLTRAIDNGRFQGSKDDAQQAVAIALLKAVDSYDPDRSRFVTHATWAIRAELKTLGWQLQIDQRPCNRARGARTVSGDAAIGGEPEAGTLFDQLADPASLEAAESGVAGHFATRALDAIIDAHHRREQHAQEARWRHDGVPADQFAPRRAALAEAQRSRAAIVRAYVLTDASAADVAIWSRQSRPAVNRLLDAYFAR